MKTKKPNVVFVFGDQHRLCDVGYAGNNQVKTPNLDRIASQSCELTWAISGMPVCCPYRASLMTGQYPLRHGVFLNDLCLDTEGEYLGEAFKRGGYDTAYVGKWHLDGHGRESFIPRERRRGFDYWQVLECTHDYNHSPYFGDSDRQQLWQGYDAFAQTDCAIDYIKSHDREHPFFLILSYGPPHNPYETAPDEYKRMYNPDDIVLRPNVPEDMQARARADIAGYYAHISALDHAIGKLYDAIFDAGIGEDTIFIYTSDHGDMLYSQGEVRKQKPWDESIRVPFVLHWQNRLGHCGKLFNSIDIMPTLLDLCGLPLPDSMDGRSIAPYILGEADCNDNADDIDSCDAVIIECISPFGEYTRDRGGREYRGLRTRRYTYVVGLDAPWLLYDNERDPYQLRNLIGEVEYAEIQSKLDARLRLMLKERGDEFLPGDCYIKQRGYKVDSTGTMPYGK